MPRVRKFGLIRSHEMNTDQQARRPWERKSKLGLNRMEGKRWWSDQSEDEGERHAKPNPAMLGMGDKNLSEWLD